MADKLVAGKASMLVAKMVDCLVWLSAVVSAVMTAWMMVDMLVAVKVGN